MSCSARLPVYTILTDLVVPAKLYFGFLSLKGLVMMGLYLLGTVMALLVAWVMKLFIKSNERSYFILELPVYRNPRWKNALLTMLQKARIFVFEAGKVIMLISLLLWVLSSYGPPKKMNEIRQSFASALQQHPENEKEILLEKKTALLQHSYAGILGRSIEPAIAPLGFDWKIGIALITSFAAREVFVGTMATLYSVGEDAEDSNITLREKMNAAVRPDGSKVYSLATGISLLVFYVLAMQCMSTIAVVKRETRSWKWAIIQLLYMTGLAYLLSLAVYQLMA
jgi:ferrous iron transport protein B